MPRNLFEELSKYRELSTRRTLEAENLFGYFFDEVGQLRKNLSLFSERIEEIKELHTQILTNVFSAEETQNVRNKLQERMDKTKLIIKDIKLALQKMKSKVDEDSSFSRGKIDAVYRIKNTQHETIHRQFYLLLSEYNHCQNIFRENSEQRIKRQFEIASKEVTDEEIRNYLEQGPTNILSMGIFTDTEQARIAMAEIEARHNDIVKLEQTIVELTGLFTEIQDLVQNQGELIDRIEYNVGLTQDYVEEANVNLKKAEQYQSSARKKKIILGIVLLVILIIVIGGVAGGIKANEKK